MSGFSFVLLGLLALWFLISLLAQFRRVAWLGDWVSRVKSRDTLALIPAWTFFAPNPGTRDFELLFRDRLVEGQYTPWKELERPVGSILRAIWNPAKRRQKAVVDMCSLLTRMAAGNKTELGARQVVLSVPYLGLLTYVSSLKAGPLSTSRQFLIATTFGHHSDKKPEILYVSHLHALNEEEEAPRSEWAGTGSAELPSQVSDV